MGQLRSREVSQSLRITRLGARGRNIACLTPQLARCDDENANIWIMMLMMMSSHWLHSVAPRWTDNSSPLKDANPKRP